MSSPCPMLRSASAARSSSFGSEEILMFATPSTVTLMNSFVGTASLVLTSTCMTRSDSLSSRSKKGMRKPARPMRIRRRVSPVMIYAVSGGALIYPAAKKMMSSTTTATATRMIGTIVKPPVYFLCFQNSTFFPVCKHVLTVVCRPNCDFFVRLRARVDFFAQKGYNNRYQNGRRGRRRRYCRVTAHQTRDH